MKSNAMRFVSCRYPGRVDHKPGRKFVSSRLRRSNYPVHFISCSIQADLPIKRGSAVYDASCQPVACVSWCPTSSLSSHK